MSRKFVAPSMALVLVTTLVGWLLAVPASTQPTPAISASVGANAIEIENFTGMVDVQVLDEPGGSVLGTGSVSDGEGVLSPGDTGVDLEAGMEIVASDGTTEKRLELVAPTIDVLDVADDVTSGRAPAGFATISVIAHGGGGDECGLSATITNGRWEVDFGAAFCARDLTYDTEIEIFVSDADNDRAFTRWQRPTCDGQEATIFGTPDAETLVGTGGPDVIHALGGGDTVNGKGGGDTICGGGGHDTLNGNNGRDTILGGNGRDTINGGKKADTIKGNGGADTINGDGGGDTVEGNGGPDVINGGGGDDTISGGAKRDELAGGKGDDTINGDNGRDTIRGGAGTDTCDGGAGQDDVAGC